MISSGSLPRAGCAAHAEEIVQERGDVVSQSIGVEIVGKRVGAVLRVEADFDILLSPVVVVQDFSNLVAEVSFDFQNQSANRHFVVARPVEENLLRERAQAAARLSAADCANDCMS